MQRIDAEPLTNRACGIRVEAKRRPVFAPHLARLCGFRVGASGSAEHAPEKPQDNGPLDFADHPVILGIEIRDLLAGSGRYFDRPFRGSSRRLREDLRRSDQAVQPVHLAERQPR